MIKLYISDSSNIYEPVVKEGIEWETERSGSPGKLTFTIYKDSSIEHANGNSVMLDVDGKRIFYGFIFSMSRSNDGLIKIVAYDQLRYLKNKDTYVYKNKTATELIQMIANDFKLQTGSLADTEWKIAQRIEDNTTLFDMIQNALNETLMNSKKLYVMYDDVGRITLKNIEDMKLDLLIDNETGQNFDYTNSIDSQTYNKIKLTREDKEEGVRKVWIAMDSNNQNKWGILQYYDTVGENENGQAKADALLSLYNSELKSLSIKEAFGDVRVRGGSSVIVQLDLGDTKIQTYMLVESARHKFDKDLHTMTLKLKGGVVNG